VEVDHLLLNKMVTMEVVAQLVRLVVVALVEEVGVLVLVLVLMALVLVVALELAVQMEILQYQVVQLLGVDQVEMAKQTIVLRLLVVVETQLVLTKLLMVVLLLQKMVLVV